MRSLVVNRQLTSNKPIYCKNCQSHNSWKRQPERDFKLGNIIEQGWKCGNCAAQIIVPIKDAK